MRVFPHLFFTNSVAPAPFRARLLHGFMNTSRQLINVLETIGSTSGAPSEHSLELNSHATSVRWAAFVFGSGGSWVFLHMHCCSRTIEWQHLGFAEVASPAAAFLVVLMAVLACNSRQHH